MLPPFLIFAPRHHPCRSSHCLIRRAASGVHFFVAPQGSAVCPAAKERVQFFNIWKWGWAKNEGEGEGSKGKWAVKSASGGGGAGG